jgi:hypothetical protein
VYQTTIHSLATTNGWVGYGLWGPCVGLGDSADDVSRAGKQGASMIRQLFLHVENLNL